MKKGIQFSKVILLLGALYFAFHAIGALIQRCAEINYVHTTLAMEWVILGLAVIGLIATAIMIWNDL